MSHVDFPAPPHRQNPSDAADDDEPTGVDMSDNGGTGVPPPSPAAPFFSLPVKGWLVATVAAMMGLAVFAPLFLFMNRGEDLYALLCLLPTLGLFMYVGIRGRAEVHLRQLFVRYSLGWIALMPLSWIAAFSIIMLGTIVMMIFVHVLPPLPGIVYAVIYCAMVFFAITSAEQMLMWAVLTRVDSVEALPHPRQYPFYAGSIALGMSSASSYYLVLFLRFLEEAAVESCRDVERRSGTPAPSSIYSGGSGDAGDRTYDSGSASSAAAGAAIRSFTALASRHGSHTSGTHSDHAAVTDSPDERVCKEPMSGSEILVLIVALVLFIQPMVLFASYHAGLVAARIQSLKITLNPCVELFPTVVIRTGFFMTMLFAPMLLHDATIFILAIIAAILLFVVKRYEKHMPQEYIDRVGSLNMLGYGRIPQTGDTMMNSDAFPDHEAVAEEYPPVVARGTAPTATADVHSHGADEDEMDDV